MDRSRSVSYTHLDVYKRQGIACTILLGMVALAVFIFIKIGIKLSPLQYLEQEPFETEYGVTAVSYTHLDVYKRQVQKS